MISPESHDALRALLLIADRGGSAPLALPVIADAVGLAPDRLAPLLGRLAEARIVRVAGGPGGGYNLSRPASVISFGDVLRSLGEPLALGSAAGGRAAACRDCTEQRLCAVHRALAEAAKASSAILDGMSLAQAAGWQSDDESGIELFDPCI